MQSSIQSNQFIYVMIDKLYMQANTKHVTFNVLQYLTF